MAQRIQRKRVKGWRMPEGAVYVGRPSLWGNHFVVRRSGHAFDVARAADGQFVGQSTGEEAARDMAVRHFTQWLHSFDGALLRQWARTELAGKDLACWCPLDQPCHADILLDLANRKEA